MQLTRALARSTFLLKNNARLQSIGEGTLALPSSVWATLAVTHSDNCLVLADGPQNIDSHVFLMIQAAGHWEKALALNPLFPQGWFGLGYCCLKTLNHQRALQAFTRCAQQEPDNGEAWNNIAAIHLQLQHAPEAFSALSEAVKLKRDNWQTWSNYAQAALQSNNDLPAARAVQKVLLTLLQSHYACIAFVCSVLC